MSSIFSGSRMAQEYSSIQDVRQRRSLQICAIWADRPLGFKKRDRPSAAFGLNSSALLSNSGVFEYDASCKTRIFAGVPMAAKGCVQP